MTFKDKIYAFAEKAGQNYGISGDEYLGAVIGQALTYFLYRRAGAPRWAAWGLSNTAANLTVLTRGLINDRKHPLIVINQKESVDV